MGIVERDSLKLTITAYFGAFLGYINKILLFPLFLSTEEVGLANILIAISAIYAHFSALGMHSITLKFFPYFRNHTKQHNNFLTWALTFIMVGFIAMTAIFFISKNSIINYYSAKSPLFVEYYLFLIPLAFVTLIYSFFDYYLRSLSLNVFSSFSYEIILRLAITLLIVSYAMELFNFSQFVVFYTIAYSVPTLAVIFYSIYKNELHLKLKVTSIFRRLKRIILTFGLFSFLNDSSFLFLRAIDSLMIAAMIGLRETGIYTTTLFIANILQMPYRAIGKVTGPIVSECWKRRDYKKMREVYTQVSTINLIIGSLLLILLWHNLDSIFSIMPAEYAEGRYVFLIIALGKLIDMYAGLNGFILATSKKYRYDLLFTILLIITTIGLNKLFIPFWGMEGAAFATSIIILFYNAIRIIFVAYSFKMHPFLWKHIAISLIAFFSFFVTSLVSHTHNIFIDILLRTTIASLIFILPVYFLKLSGEVNGFIDKYLLLLKKISKRN